MIQNKKQMFTLIGAFILCIMLGTVTYAFFNYTRTGSANVIKTGRIAFNTSQSSGNSEAINLTNAFPITRNELENDVNNSSEVEINIVGDTTYTNGLEYLVTFEDVNIETSTNKKIPIGVEVTPEKTGELGTSNDDYFESLANGGRGGNTSYYKVLANDVLNDGDYVLVGYIRPGVAEVNGTIVIKAFIDRDKILISDTYDGSESDNMGTPRSKAEGKVVLTTEEWNSLQGDNSISFKIRIQANEGIWVGDPLSRNDMVNIYSANTFTSAQKSAITEINFIRMSEEMINTHADLIDLTAQGGQGVVKGWIDGTKLYIASPGETYFPEDSSSLLSNFTNVTKFNFNNINTSIATNFQYLFSGDISLAYLDLGSFDTSNVTNMTAMFISCHNLTSIDLTNLNTQSVTTMPALFFECFSLTKIDLSGLGSSYLTSVGSMFNNCTNLQEVNMSGFNFGTSVNSLFSGVGNSLQSINLSNANMTNVTDMSDLFNNLTGLQSVNLSNIRMGHIVNVSYMFENCTNLREINMSGFNFGTASMSGLFDQLSNLETVNLNNTNTNNVSNMGGLFYKCSKLEKVDLSGLGGNNLSDIGGMFNGCTNLKEINMSGFNFGTASLSGQFYSGYVPNIETIDLTNANISNVSNMTNLFAGDSHLKTIYVSNSWNVNNITSSNGMFNGCTSLVGGVGTTYDENNPTDKTYARIDGGPQSETPGYFTLKTN